MSHAEFFTIVTDTASCISVSLVALSLTSQKGRLRFSVHPARYLIGNETAFFAPSWLPLILGTLSKSQRRYVLLKQKLCLRQLREFVRSAWMIGVLRCLDV